MKNVYISDSYEKEVTGFTTYKRELLKCLNGTPHITLGLIEENCPDREVCVQTDKDVKRFYLPCIESVSHKYFIMGSVLKQYIEDTSDNVFFLNYSPTARLLTMLKEFFPKSKAVYVIHDFIWATYLLGDVERLRQVVQDGYDVGKCTSVVRKAYEDNVQTLQLADCIVCLSTDTYKLLHTFFQISQSKLRLIPNGLEDYASYRSRPLSTNGAPKIILAVGRVNQQKGMLDLLCSFKNVIKHYPSCQLVIAGEASQAVIDSLDKTLRDKVCLLGTISQTELHAWYRKADIGVVPSYYEQCSYAGIEMKMFGLPVIASDGFGVRSMFYADNALTAVIDRMEPIEYRKHLSDALLQLLTAPEEVRIRYRELSRKDYLHRYTLMRMQREYVNLIENL